MKVLLLSLWFADAGRHITDRAMHLMSKPGVTRWLFGVRPGLDCTPESLAVLADYVNAQNLGISVEDHVQPEERIERLSVAGDRLLDAIEDEDYVLWHESDLFTPDTIVQRLAALDVAVAGGWPVLSHHPDYPELGIKTRKRLLLGDPVFYDTWGYRKDGKRFKNQPPYHDCYRPEPFPLDSVGSVVLIKGDYIRKGARMNGGGLVGLCESVRQMGGQVWCDPVTPVVQPCELWRFNDD